MFNNSSSEKEKEKDAAPNVWQQVLKESSSRTHLLEEKSVVVLGDRNSGKSSLVARLQNVELAPESAAGVGGDGVALDYAYLDIYPTSHSDELLGRSNIWTLEGDLGHVPLLDFGLNENTINKAIAVVVLDLAVPWKLEESLEKWLKVLSDHIEALKSKLGKGVFEGLQRKNILAFQQYRDPSTIKASADPTSHALVSSLSSSTVDLDNEELPTLADGILTHNLGVPIVVVCNKADSIAMLEKEYSYKDDTFVYIQQYLRRICLKYGAALIYASAKRNTNCDILKNYLLHQLYSFEFSVSAQLADKDTIFVPSGWDSLPKIEIEFSSQKVCNDADLPFSEVIKRPAILQQHKSIYEAEVLAEEDQEFLSNKLKLIEKSEQQNPASSILTNSPLPTHLPSEPTTPYSAVDKTPVRRPVATGLATPKDPKSAAAGGAYSPLVLPERGTTASPRAAAAAASAKTTEHKVLSDFFSNLLSKDPRKGSSAGVAGTPVAAAGTRPARTPAPAAATTPTPTPTPTVAPTASDADAAEN